MDDDAIVHFTFFTHDGWGHANLGSDPGNRLDMCDQRSNMTPQQGRARTSAVADLMHLTASKLP